MSADYVQAQIREAGELLAEIAGSQDVAAKVTTVAGVCVSALQQGRKLLFAGNGGSAADCLHMAAEYVSRLNFDRPGLAAIALTVDTSALTAIGNDYGYEKLFVRQLEAIGRAGDVLFAYSTSGNSPNVVSAIRRARELGIFVAGLTGNRRGEMTALCDECFEIPSASTQRIQEAHLVIGHCICSIVEQRIFGAAR